MTDLYTCKICGNEAETLSDRTCEECVAELELIDKQNSKHAVEPEKYNLGA